MFVEKEIYVNFAAKKVCNGVWVSPRQQNHSQISGHINMS